MSFCRFLSSVPGSYILSLSGYSWIIRKDWFKNQMQHLDSSFPADIKSDDERGTINILLSTEWSSYFSCSLFTCCHGESWCHNSIDHGFLSLLMQMLNSGWIYSRLIELNLISCSETGNSELSQSESTQFIFKLSFL